MIFYPKNFKFEKLPKNRYAKSVQMSHSSNSLLYGAYGLKVVKAGRIYGTQFDSLLHVVVTQKKLQKIGKYWFRVFPDVSATSKGLGSRMGKGKGASKQWLVGVKAGQVIFEISSDVAPHLAISTLKIMATKLAMPSKIIVL